MGNVGPLSGVLSVNTREGTVLHNGEPTLTGSTLEALPDVFMCSSCSWGCRWFVPPVSPSDPSN